MFLCFSWFATFCSRLGRCVCLCSCFFMSSILVCALNMVEASILVSLFIYAFLVPGFHVVLFSTEILCFGFSFFCVYHVSKFGFDVHSCYGFCLLFAYNWGFYFVCYIIPPSFRLVIHNYKNINWQSWSTISDNTQSKENKFIECLRDNFLFQHVNNPTRGRGSDTPHLLDLVITNIERMVTDIEHMSPLGKSDHSILSLKLSCYSKINTYNKTKIYYDKADYDTIKNELNDAEWINNIQNNQEDINKQWEIFTTKVNQLIKIMYRIK